MTDRWESVALQDSAGGNAAVQRTTVHLCHVGERLRLRFDCDDRDIWGNYRRRNDPLYEEECVELFIAPGEGDPAAYFEIEVSPRNTVFAARISNPHSRRSDMTADLDWPCEGLVTSVDIDRTKERWSVSISLPLASLTDGGAIPKLWRANFYRIERPRDGSPPEFSAWSPTWKSPPDFHQPRFFGLLALA